MMTSWIEFIKIFERLDEINICVTGPDTDMQILGLTYDSKKVNKGTLFVCKGINFKKQYLIDALDSGAIAYVSQVDYAAQENDLQLKKRLASTPHVIVKDIRKCMPDMARVFYKFPEDQLKKVAITGTAGKTTSAYCVKKIYDEYLAANNKNPMSMFSSVEIDDGKSVEFSPNQTTPESFELYRRFLNVYESKREYVVMEVSSQALKVGRTSGIEFETAIFTNISNDHVSSVEHPTYEDYLETKLKIFKQAKNAVINIGSDDIDKILDAASSCEKIVTYAATKELEKTISAKPQCTFNENKETLSKADYKLLSVNEGQEGLTFTIEGPDFKEEFTMPMLGTFNAMNALAAVAYCHSSGVEVAHIKSGLAKVSVPGHMQKFTSPDNKIIAFVDFAHNGLSVETVLSSVKRLYPDRKIVSVFGSTGTKAVNRRLDMGRAAGPNCDMCYLTMDSPDNESVIDIAKDIAKGVEEKGGKYIIVEDRIDAIRKAAMDIKEPAVLCVLGRGAEEMQIIDHKAVPYMSDSKIIEKIYKEIYK